MSTISNERMSAFLDTIANQAREAMHERANDILNAWHENIEEANNNEKSFPPLKLSIGATVDLEGNKIETVVRFTATYSTSICERLPDPNQPDLPGVTMTIERAGAEPVSLTPKQFKAAGRRMEKAFK